MKRRNKKELKIKELDLLRPSSLLWKISRIICTTQKEHHLRQPVTKSMVQ